MPHLVTQVGLQMNREAIQGKWGAWGEEMEQKAAQKQRLVPTGPRKKDAVPPRSPLPAGDPRATAEGRRWASTLGLPSPAGPFSPR